MIHMDGQSPSGYTSSTYIGMNEWDCSMSTSTSGGDTTCEDCGGDSGGGGETVRDVSTIEVKSLLDVFENCESFEEFWEFMWYNPWVCFVWFHFW